MGGSSNGPGLLRFTRNDEQCASFRNNIAQLTLQLFARPLAVPALCGYMGRHDSPEASEQWHILISRPA